MTLCLLEVQVAGRNEMCKLIREVQYTRNARTQMYCSILCMMICLFDRMNSVLMLLLKGHAIPSRYACSMASFNLFIISFCYSFDDVIKYVP